MTLSRRFLPRRTRVAGRVRYSPRRVRLRAGRAATELASAVGHDVSLPLSTVTNLADLLAQDWTALPDDIRRDLARHIDNGARSLATRIGHVIAVMDVLAGKARPGNAVPVRGSVDAVVATLPATAGVGVSGPPAPALMDRRHLEHVLATLIGDALTYGSPPVRVRIVPEPGSVRIEVVDHGRLAARRMRARALQPSTGRWTLVGREAAGSRALGLAVAARLVATDGGTVWQRPMRRHRGARVLVRLAAPAAGPPPP
jgi:two-component system, OmpR family, sensor histidine kinase MtrB